MVFVCAPRNFAGAKERNDLNMANMKKEYKMSAERKEELQKELTYLKTVREKEVADLIKEARGFGDLSENSEYDEAKIEQGKLYSRIAEVEEILLHTVIVDENDAGTNGISIGCRVIVNNVKSGNKKHNKNKNYIKKPANKKIKYKKTSLSQSLNLKHLNLKKSKKKKPTDFYL